VPLRVDRRPLSLRDLLRARLIKQVDGKVFHHIAQKVFPGPLAEQPDIILLYRSTESRADEADLAFALSQLTSKALRYPLCGIYCHYE
jgi:hypothetical protein